MRERDRRRAVHVAALADAVEALPSEQRTGRQTADGDDQLRPEQAQLMLAPGRAECALLRCRRPVTAAGRRLARVAAGDGGAVEGVVELVLVQPQPAAERPARAPAPRPPLLGLDDPGRLAVHVGA